MYIDYEQLKLKGNTNTFGGVHLSFYKLSPTDTVLVGNVVGDHLDKDYLKYRFEKHTGQNSIESVILTGNKALIKFFRYESKLYVNFTIVDIY